MSAPIVEQQDTVGEEGTWIGLIGASVVALWFLARDVAAGHPLRTPSVLGQVLLMGESTPNVDELDFTAGQTNWGYKLRFGLFEISEHDFALIAKAMGAKLTAGISTGCHPGRRPGTHFAADASRDEIAR